MQVLGVGERAWLLCYGFRSLNACTDYSSVWAGLHTPELGPLQSCLTGSQAALMVGRWALARGRGAVNSSGSYIFLGLHTGPSLYSALPAHTDFRSFEDKM